MSPIRWLSVAIALTFAVPAFAQFEGLDLGSSKKKKKKTKKKKTTGKKPPVENKAEEDDDGEEDPPLPTGGLDLTKPTEEVAKPPPAADPAPTDGTTMPGLDLTGDTAKPTKDVKKEKKPTMTFDELDVTGKTGDRQRLDAATALFKNEQYEAASLASYELVQDPKMAEFQNEAQYLLAKSLYRLGLYHSALSQFSKILAKGPNNNKFFKLSLEWLFFISRKTVNESVVLDEIAKYSNFEFPEKFRNEFRYLLARYHFVYAKALDTVGRKAEADKSFDEVKRLVLQIPRTDSFYPRAKYLEGLAYFRDDKHQQALESMKEVVRLTRDGAKTNINDKNLRELAFMQLARTHYGAKQNRYAIYYYGKIERGTNQWLEALFEGSWANYRIGQYEQALGNLITLSSPFFKEEYFPEALILKSVIYYENCRYRESTLILEDFERIYLPVHDELQSMVRKNLDAAEYYNLLADVQKKNKDRSEQSNTDLILERILKLALTDSDLKKTNDSIIELEGELDALGAKGDTFKYSDLTKSLIETLKKQREELIGKAGIIAKSKLESELDELKQLLANGLRIKFETTTKEKEFLEETLKAGGNVDIVKSYKYSVAVADDQLYWPYEGEYWRDELGTYQYTLTKGCIQRPQGGDAARASASSSGE